METKQPWQSKTNWVGLIIAVSAFIPAANDFIVHNPETFASSVGLLMMILRQVSSGKITIS